MVITLSPVASSRDSVISVSGDVLTIDGQPVDFSVLANGQQCEGELPLIGLVKRIDGVVHATVRYEYNSATAEPNQSPNIEDYVVDVVAGDVPDVIARKPVEVVADVEA